MTIVTLPANAYGQRYTYIENIVANEFAPDQIMSVLNHYTRG
ncbi:hypothetical protein [Pseudoalteromonas viridis]|nr:hypothetical protein [Pseudoalteromonas viridis]